MFGSVKEGRIKLLRALKKRNSCTLITVSSSSFWNITIHHLSIHVVDGISLHLVLTFVNQREMNPNNHSVIQSTLKDCMSRLLDGFLKGPCGAFDHQEASHVRHIRGPTVSLIDQPVFTPNTSNQAAWSVTFHL